jgi:hypothetical protein
MIVPWLLPRSGPDHEIDERGLRQTADDSHRRRRDERPDGVAHEQQRAPKAAGRRRQKRGRVQSVGFL